MKYKNINSMLHNFAHSFCSDMNMVFEDEAFQGFIFTKLNELLTQPGISAIAINFSDGSVEPEAARFAYLQKSVAAYQRWLMQHTVNHQIDPERIKNVLLNFTPAAKHDGRAFSCRASCSDDRGKHYEVVL